MATIIRCARCGKVNKQKDSILCPNCEKIIHIASLKDSVKYYGNSKVAEKFKQALITLGWNLNTPDLKETPQRMARVFEEYSLGLRKNTNERIKYIFSRKFPSNYDEMIIFKDIDSTSLCPHHCLPVHMKVIIAYIPVKWVLGLSKMIEFIDLICKQPILQEELTQIIAKRIQRELKPLGIGVIIKAKHDCMQIRDVKQEVPIITSCLLGVIRTKPSARQELLKLTF